MYEIHDSFYENLTRCAKLSVMLLSAEKVLPLLQHDTSKKGYEIYCWFSSAISSIWKWIEKQEFTVQDYIMKYDKSDFTYYNGYFDPKKKPKVDAAFTTCLATFFYGAKVMYSFAPLELRMDFKLPSDIIQTNTLITTECLEWAVKASDDEQAELAWQEKVINQLLKDHYTEEFDALGELIGREYFKPFL